MLRGQLSPPSLRHGGCTDRVHTLSLKGQNSLLVAAGLAMVSGPENPTWFTYKQVLCTPPTPTSGYLPAGSP